jgi:beta-lactamase superfamily II metal-dependent hydrolase
MRFFLLLTYSFLSITLSWASGHGEKHHIPHGKETHLPKKLKEEEVKVKEEEGEGQAAPQPKPKVSKEEPSHGITITYYNVGQGNCVLMKNHQYNQAVLVDCGSTEGSTEDGEKLRIKEGKMPVDKSEIKKDIESKLAGVELKNILVIVTHLDRDHYDWILGIEGLQEKEVRFLISSSKSLKLSHHGNAKEGIEKEFLAEIMKKHKENLIHVNTPESLTEAIKSLNLDSWITPLTAASGSIAKEEGVKAESANSKNADSVVIKAYSENCSALLTGDANEASAGAIEHEDKDKDLKATVVLAPHHGAISQGSSNGEWVENTSPEAVIVSAGHYPKYAHPRCEVLKRYSEHKVSFIKDGVHQNESSIKDGKSHELTCFDGHNRVGFEDFISSSPQNDINSKTTKAIYNNLSFG